MQTKMVLVSAGFLLAVTGCGSPEDSNGMELGSDTKGLGRPGQHCVSKAFAQPAGLPVPEKLPATQFDCFNTFADAIAHASKGAVQLPANATPENLKPEDEARMAAAANIIAIEYDLGSFTGPTWTISSDVTCSMGYILGAAATPPGWDNVVSSARSYGGCNNAYHYESANYSGANTNCFSSCSFSSLLMDNQTSSILWTP
jgi:hypothetical protein